MEAYIHIYIAYEYSGMKCFVKEIKQIDRNLGSKVYDKYFCIFAQINCLEKENIIKKKKRKQIELECVACIFLKSMRIY